MDETNLLEFLGLAGKHDRAYLRGLLEYHSAMTEIISTLIVHGLDNANVVVLNALSEDAERHNLRVFADRIDGIIERRKENES